jgi:hypothetical protein
VANADGPGLSGNNAYTDSTNPDLERSRGGNDVTHSFSGSLILQLPKLEDKGPFVKTVFGDWEFTSIVRAATGYPVTVVTGGVGGVAGNGNAPSGSGNGNQLNRPNLVEGVDCQAKGGDKTQWLNPAAWTLNGYVLGSNGNAGRNICNGPGSFQTDASLYKNIRLGSRVKLQLRFEMFNVFNTVNFLGGGLTNGGVQSSYNAQNVVLNAAGTQIISANPVGNFGQLTTARDPRTMQLGIRLAF